MVKLLPLSLLLPGCIAMQEDLSPSADAGGETEVLVGVWSQVGPETRLALVYDLGRWLPGDESCPTLLADSEEPGLERWVGADPSQGAGPYGGGCETADGARIQGVLERYEGTPDAAAPWGAVESAWVSGDHFQVWDPSGTLVFHLDGAVEVTSMGEITLVEAAVTTCGFPGPECDGADPEEGLLALDLASTLFPSRAFPDRYDLTLSGLVALPGREPATVYGAWSVDRAACEGEPASGNLVVGLEHSHYLDFDGALACDSCALRSIDGSPAGSVCERWMP